MATPAAAPSESSNVCSWAALRSGAAEESPAGRNQGVTAMAKSQRPGTARRDTRAELYNPFSSRARMHDVLPVACV